MGRWVVWGMGLALIGAPLALMAQNVMPAAPIPTVGSSLLITTGNTFQQLLPSVPVNSGARRSLTIQNNNVNGDLCWVYIGTLAQASTPTAIQLGQGIPYGRYYPYVPSDQINVTCTTAGDAVYADYQ